jgi:hypothetical protein
MTTDRAPLADVTARANDMARELTKGAKDAAYIGIGLAVLTAQQVQGRLNAAKANVPGSASFGSFSLPSFGLPSLDLSCFDGVRKAGADFDAARRERVGAAIKTVENQVDAVLDQVETVLPNVVRPYARKAREVGTAARSRMKELADLPA